MNHPFEEETTMRTLLCGLAAVAVLLAASAAARAAEEKDKNTSPVRFDSKGKKGEDDDKDEKKGKGKKEDDKDEKKGDDKGKKGVEEKGRPAAVLTIDLSQLPPETVKKILALLEEAKKGGKK